MRGTILCGAVGIHRSGAGCLSIAWPALSRWWAEPIAGRRVLVPTIDKSDYGGSCHYGLCANVRLGGEPGGVAGIGLAREYSPSLFSIHRAVSAPAWVVRGPRGGWGPLGFQRGAGDPAAQAD